MDIICSIGFGMCMIGSAIEFVNGNMSAGIWAAAAAIWALCPS